jgi:hypothetical protein
VTLTRAGCFAALLLVGCGGGKPASQLPTGMSGENVGVPVPKKPVPPMPLTGYVVTELGGGTIGPFFARRGSGEAASGMVGWVTGAEGSGRRLVVVPVAADGKPKDAEHTAALVPNDTTMLVLRPLRGPMPGFVAAWTALTDRGESLWAAVLDDSGAPRGKAMELSRTNDDVVWVDIIPTDHGAVCVWAEETRSGDANVTIAAIDGNGTVRGTPSRVARGVVGWHALEIAGGVGISTVTAAVAGDKDKKKSASGSLTFTKLDADGHPVGAPIAIGNKPNVSGDVEVIRADPRILFAWTDRTSDEPAVIATSLDENGKSDVPKRLVEGRGGAALLGLTHGPAGTAVMFEAPVRKKAERRRVHVARISPNLAFEGKPHAFEVSGRSPPELVTTASGFATLASLRDCEPGSPACEDVPTVATLVRFDANLTLVQKEPFAFNADPASLGWGLACDGDLCQALAATPGAPTRVRTAVIRPRSNVVAPPAPAAPPPDAPKLEDVAAIASGESVVDIATAKLGGGTLLATLTTKNEKAKPLSLTTRILDATGNPSAPIVLSTKALAIGGVAVAAAEKADDGGAVAWVARENGDPEVHVTRIDKKGKRTADIQLTTVKGDASDVTITWAGGGWVVAWVDGRDGNGEVYATKVDLMLNRTAREERITNAPGDASDLVAHAKGDLVWLAWADTRESPKDGMADVFVAAVKMRDAKRATGETRVLATAAHSRTPQLVASESGMHVAWIEEAPLGNETPGASGFGALWTTIDEQGKVTGKPQRMPLAGDGAASSVALEVLNGKLRAVVARSTSDSISLDAIDLTVPNPRGFSILTLDGPPSLDVAMVMNDGALFFNDDGPSLQDKRARRARIAWR